MGILIFETISIFSTGALFLIALLQAQWTKLGNFEKFFFLLGVIMNTVLTIISCYMEGKIRKTKRESTQDLETINWASSAAVICILLRSFGIMFTFPFLDAIGL